MTTSRQLDSAARRLAAVLRHRKQRIVFAESCTGGLISAVLAKIPGISEIHCGSAVVYRMGTKQEWLGVPADLLEKPGPVSRQVAEAMARGVLERTPEADVAASVTGHLGPDAPRRQDGLIYVGIVQRSEGRERVKIQDHRLPAAADAPSPAEAKRLRHVRQRTAARFVLKTVSAALEG